MKPYRFGFNGQEKQEEINPLPYNFENRPYDPRRGQFPTTDRLASQFPYQSPYVFAGNNPILYIDENGDKKTIYYTIIKNGYSATFNVENENSFKIKYHPRYETLGEFKAHDYTQHITIDYTQKGLFGVPKEIITKEEVSDKSISLKERAKQLFKSSNDKTYVKGGVLFYTDNLDYGTSEETKFTETPDRMVNIDDILTMFSSPASGKGLKGMMDVMSWLNGASDNIAKVQRVIELSQELKSKTFGEQQKVYDKATRATWKDSLGYFGRADGEKATDTVDTRNDDTPTSLSKISNKLNK